MNSYSITLAFPVLKWMSFAIGIRPSMKVDYRESSINYISNSPSFALYQSENEGVINEVFVEQGISITKKLKIGIKGGYYFGSITNSINIDILSGISTNTSTLNNEAYHRYFSGALGLLYSIPLREESKILI